MFIYEFKPTPYFLVEIITYSINPLELLFRISLVALRYSFRIIVIFTLGKKMRPKEVRGWEEGGKGS